MLNACATRFDELNKHITSAERPAPALVCRQHDAVRVGRPRHAPALRALPMPRATVYA